MRREKEEKGRKFAKLTVSHSIDTASKEREMNTGLECEKRQKSKKKFRIFGKFLSRQKCKEHTGGVEEERGGEPPSSENALRRDCAAASELPEQQSE